MGDNMKCFVTLLAMLLIPFSIEGRSRVRRQGAVFMVLSNTTLPCEELMLQEGPDVKRVELTDAQKMEVFLSQGGQYRKDLMAVTKDEAKANFPSLLGGDLVIDGKRRTFPTKDEIRKFMINEVYSGVNPPTSRNSVMSYKDYMGRLQDIKDLKKRASLWQEWQATGSEKGEHFPYMFPEMLGLPRYYTTSAGATTEQEVCYSRGTYTMDPQYLRMCTVCTTTRALPADVWPEHVNEASCSLGDSGCLIVDGLPHGRCQQIYMTVEMLQKQVEQCTLVLVDGTKVIAEQWQVAPQAVAVGCECAVHENSYFAEFL